MMNDCFEEVNFTASHILLKMITQAKQIKTDLNVSVDTTSDTKTDEEDFVVVDNPATITLSTRDKAEKELEYEYGMLFRFLWAIHHEPQLINKILTRPCVKPSTETWAEDLHTQLLGHIQHTIIGIMLSFNTS